MSRSQIVATNQAVLRALGIDQPLLNAVQIRMHPDHLPMVTIERYLDAQAMATTVQDFDLVLRDDGAPAPAARPALDLDGMCAAARTRLAADVGTRAATEFAAHARESAAIRVRLSKAIDRHQTTTAQALHKLAMRGLVNTLAARIEGLFTNAARASFPPTSANELRALGRFESIGSAMGGARK